MNISKKYYVIIMMYTSSVFCAHYNANEELGSIIRRYATRNDIAEVAESRSASYSFKTGEKARAEGYVPTILYSRTVPPIGEVEVIEIMSPYQNEKPEHNQYLLLNSKGRPVIIKQAKEPNQKEGQKDQLAKL